MPEITKSILSLLLIILRTNCPVKFLIAEPDDNEFSQSKMIFLNFEIHRERVVQLPLAKKSYSLEHMGEGLPSS